MLIPPHSTLPRRSWRSTNAEYTRVPLLTTQRLAQDDEIFNRARLVNCGYFMQIILGDYVGAILGLVRDDRDPRKWTFDGLVRGADGRFKDSDLATILQNSTSWRAGAYRHGNSGSAAGDRGAGNRAARRWGACSMNDFRRFLGLKPYASFQEWNSDKSVHVCHVRWGPLQALTGSDGCCIPLQRHRESRAVCGLASGGSQAADAWSGSLSGIYHLPFYFGRCGLPDPRRPIPDDRIHTVESDCLGLQDCQFDAQDGSYGGMLTKLLFRTLPEYYPRRSAYAHFPFLDPHSCKLDGGEHKSLVGEYIWTKPESMWKGGSTCGQTESAVREVLADQTVFPNGYADRVMEVTGHSTVDHTFVNDLLLKENAKWTDYFVTETRALIAQLSFGNVSKKVQYIDIVRDVINVLPGALDLQGDRRSSARGECANALSCIRGRMPIHLPKL
ncbi:unnamed protein product [Mycena citricolor]|uniref:Uncharacterized protein n=1 Tax=Mycena citricolor TaxID=2018698 RepID=A0AAD2GRR1_9AGAR|nr:unnamed protein product [Mycena citricolor]